MCIRDRAAGVAVFHPRPGTSRYVCFIKFNRGVSIPFFGYRDASGEGLEAVSYTHLDVYKRQVPPPMSPDIQKRNAQATVKLKKTSVLLDIENQTTFSNKVRTQNTIYTQIRSD